MKYLFYCLIIVLVAGCEKNKLANKTEIDPTGEALVKIGYFTPWLRNAPALIKVNDVVYSSTITYAISYPGGGFNQGGQTFADYLGIDAGLIKSPVKISLAVPKVGTSTDSIPLFSSNFTLQPNKRQTIFLTDSIPNIQATVVIDETQDPPAGLASFKFFNGIPNVGVNLDLYAVSAAGTFLVASNIAYKGVSPVFNMPAGAIGNITFSLVRTGLPLNTTNTVGSTLATTALLNGRVYTVLSRGFMGVGTATTEIRRPQISIIVNR